MDWIMNHWVEVCAAFGLFVTAFAAIAKLTPWKWDDKAADFLVGIADLIRRKK